MVSKIRLKGHESFVLREGWVRKGLAAIKEFNSDDIYEEKSENYGKDVFSRVDATDILGVGTNMVKSIKYWLQATGLIETINIKNKRFQALTKDFGEVINGVDPYIEEISTLWLLHYKLATNRDVATSWYLFFNQLKLKEFTKDELFNGLQLLIEKINPELNYSKPSLQDDCNCIVRTYTNIDMRNSNPEDNLLCPFSDLNLIKKKKGKKEVFIKVIPDLRTLSKLVILYVIIDNLGDKSSTSIDALIEDDCNIGKVFNLDRMRINDYLNALQKDGYITINRTAGLDTIYINNKIDRVKLLESIYAY